MRATSWKAFGVAVVMVLGVSFEAQALTITPGPEVLSGTETSEALIGAAISAYFASVSVSANSLYKSDDEDDDSGDGIDDGSAASWYNTAFSPPDDASDALITWTGGSFINSSPIYLLVKDGNAIPAWYLFNISGWNGKDDIELNDFWPQKGAISHVTLYAGSTSVPDGGSAAMLLGMALAGLAGVRRMLS